MSSEMTFIANEEEILQQLTNNGMFLRHLRNSTMEMKMVAVKQNGLAIQFIHKDDHSYDMKMEAVKQNPLLAYIFSSKENHSIDIKTEEIVISDGSVQINTSSN